MTRWWEPTPSEDDTGPKKGGGLAFCLQIFKACLKKAPNFRYINSLLVGFREFFFSIDSGFQDRLYIHNLSMKDGDFQAVQVVFVEIQDPRVKNTCRKDVRPFICVALMPIRFLYYKGFDNLDSHCYTKSP